MQPYLFPYIGYLQLVSASDIFIFYDDVDFIKGGWINRNKIAINGKENLFTVPLDSASPNKKINETFIHKGWRRDKLLKKIRLAYANAPMFDKVFPVVKSVVENAVNRSACLPSPALGRSQTILESTFNSIVRQIFQSPTRLGGLTDSLRSPNTSTHRCTSTWKEVKSYMTNSTLMNGA